jgi:hypothetical protein
MVKTAVAMVTIGPSSPTRLIAVRRAQDYARLHGYSFIQVSQRIIPDADRTPHWNKLLIPKVYPGYGRYLIIDDDVLINTKVAPSLPSVAAQKLGIVREPVSMDFDPPMRWLGNSGVLLVPAEATDILTKAYQRGVIRGKIPGIADQPAVNVVAWSEDRVERLNWRWNYILMADWLITAHRQIYPWTPNRFLARLAKLTLTLRLAVSACSRLVRKNESGSMQRLRESHFVHLIWFRVGAKLVDHYLG